MLYPGSGSEAARRVYRDAPYRLLREGRLGFLRLALRFDAEVLFVAALGIDEMYYQSSLPTPRWMLRMMNSERYAGSRLQFGLLGPHLAPGFVPLPVQITHVVSEPLDLGNRAATQVLALELAKRFTITTLVHNAGSIRPALLADMQLADLDALTELHLACAVTLVPRPAWLLAAPRMLAARDGRPWLDGPLDLLAGPERIESGWWDGRDVARDYFLARDSRGGRFWVFRERRERGGWYLHGVFA